METEQQLVPQELANFLVERDSIISDCREIVVIDEATNLIAAEGLGKLRKLVKRIKEMADAARRPYKDEITKINSSEKFLTDGCLEADRHLVFEQQKYRSAQIEAQRKEQERQNRLAIKRAERAEEKGIERPVPEVVPPIVQGPSKKIETDSGSVSFRTDWKAERIPGKEKDIPIEYFHNEDVYKVVDIKIGAIARATKGSVQIPGYRIFSVQTPITR